MSEADDKVSILLVDDQLQRLLSYEAILGELGQHLVCARSGEEALKLLMQSEFAVILLDVNMPGMDGFETAALIHQHPRFERTPIIFVSGVNVTEFDRLKGYKLGAVDYVLVPVVPEILRSKVMVLVELYRQRAELKRLNDQLAGTNAELAHANALLKVEKAKELDQLNQHLEAANQQLLKSAQRKDEFLAILGHELRNPLASICNALEIIRVRQLNAPDPELVWPREVLSRQIGKLTRLVDDLLDIARITRDQIELRRGTVNLQQIADNAVESNLPILDARRQRLDVQRDADDLLADGDAIRLCQAISNLIGNAARYSPEGSAIRLELRREGAWALCRVIDRGYGIPPHMLEQIFDPFVQVRETRDTSTGGLGLGLAIVRKLIDLHGGKVSVQSEGLNRGSTFEIRLPLLTQSPTAAPVTEAAPTRAVARGRQILLADDDLDSANSLALMLRLHGHTVWIAANGAEAVDLAGRHQPEAVLLDIGMPVMDGYEAARRIRAEAWGRSMLLIALTGWGQQEDRHRTSQAGFDQHKVKPISATELVNLFAGDDWLERQRRAAA